MAARSATTEASIFAVRIHRKTPQKNVSTLFLGSMHSGERLSTGCINQPANGLTFFSIGWFDDHTGGLSLTLALDDLDCSAHENGHFVVFVNGWQDLDDEAPFQEKLPLRQVDLDCVPQLDLKVLPQLGGRYRAVMRK